MNVSPNILAKNENLKKLRWKSFVDERAMITTPLYSSCNWKTLLPFCLLKKRPWIIPKSYRKTNYAIQNNRKLAIYWYMMLFSHWLFWLKNCRLSTNSCKDFVISLIFRFLFWTNSKNLTIERSSLSGENRKSIAYVSGLGSIAIDHTTKRLHVIDHFEEYLISVNYDGKDLQYHAWFGGFWYGFAVVPEQQMYYYSQFVYNSVYMLDYSTDKEEFVYKAQFDNIGNVQIPVKLEENGNVIFFLFMLNSNSRSCSW